MKNLVYKFVKNFDSVDESSFTETNYLCKDNYIHIRLRRFGHKVEHLVGFESKLTFLVTLLMSNAVNNHITTSQVKLSKDKENYQELWESCLAALKESKEFKSLEFELSMMFEGYKGLKILPMYSLKYKPENAFDLIGECYNLPKTTINTLLRCEFNDDLYSFLFDNNVEVYIEKKYNINDTKFIKKYSRVKKEPYINLWTTEVM